MVKTCLTGSCVIIEKNMVVLENSALFKKWMLPGGHQLENESPQDTAMRISKAITEIDVSLIDYALNRDELSPYGKDEIQPITVLVENVEYEDGLHRHLDMIFLAKPMTLIGAKIERNAQVKWFPINELQSIDIDPNVKEVIIRGGSYIYDIESK
ncbi:MAG: NUDIX domain-containing protein [Thermoplasmataceae archaeon]